MKKENTLGLGEVAPKMMGQKLNSWTEKRRLSTNSTKRNCRCRQSKTTPPSHASARIAIQGPIDYQRQSDGGWPI